MRAYLFVSTWGIGTDGGFGMAGITEADVAAAIGRIDEIIIREVVRTGASRPELRRALAFARGPADMAACSALPPRMQRLVDLLAVALPEAERLRGRKPALREAYRAA